MLSPANFPQSSGLPNAAFVILHPRFIRLLRFLIPLRAKPCFFLLRNKSFLTPAKNIVFLSEQNLPYLLNETPLFSQRFMKKINRVKRMVR